MIKTKHKNILIISFIIIFCILSIVTTIIAENILHNEHYCVSNCSICILINFSTEFIRNIIYLTINISAFIVWLTLIHLMKKNIEKNKKQTLIELKVIQIN